MPEVFVAPHNNYKKSSYLTNLLVSFYENPQDVRFNDQHKGEKILLLLRRHWITNVPWIVISFFLLLVPIFGIPFINVNEFININFPLNFILVGFLFWYLFTFGFILINFLFWFYNVGIITNERIIDVDFVYLLYSEITSTIIEKIEDVTSKRAGFLSIFVDSGNVFVQTAGTEPNIDFNNIPKPNLVIRIITQLLQRRR